MSLVTSCWSWRCFYNEFGNEMVLSMTGTYFLMKVRKVWQWWMQCYLLARRWRSGRICQPTPDAMKSNITYNLEGEGEAICQPTLHGMALPLLTPLKFFPFNIPMISLSSIRAAISTAPSFVSVPIWVSKDWFTRLNKPCLHRQSAASGVSLTNASTILLLPRSIAMWSGAPNSDPTSYQCRHFLQLIH